MRKFKYSLRWINNHEQLVKSHREQMLQDGATEYLLQQNRKQLDILNALTFAIALLVLILWFKTLRDGF